MEIENNEKGPDETLTQYLARMWGGRKFKCGITGEEITLPSVIHRGQFFAFGQSFVDVGDEFMCRFGGNPVELEIE